MTYPSGRVVKHEYDAIGRVQNVKNNATQANYATGAAYNPAGQITGFSYGNGATAAMGYSAQRLQLTSLSYAQGGTTHLSLAYGYSQGGNNNGQIASVTDSSGETGAGGRTVNYTYDSLHRLLTAQTTGSAQYPQWGLSWTGVYPERVRHSRTSRRNRFGNRSAQTVTAGSGPSNSVTIDAATNRITAMGGYTFYYDANGNLTQDDFYKYKYDAENRLVEVRLLNNTLVSTYAFDGKSLRISKVVGADRTMYVYAGTEMISEYEDAASNTYNPGTTPGQAGSDSTATMLYQHGDHLTTRVTTENNGDLSSKQGHYPYGESWYEALTANPSVLRKYTTYLRDDETTSGKLNYAVFRLHSARTGRFLMTDRVSGRGWNPQRLNRYAYVGGEAISRKDSRGSDWEVMGWPGWGEAEVNQCVDPTSPLCGNHAFWSSITPMQGGSFMADSRASRWFGLADAVLAFLGEFFLPDWFPPFPVLPWDRPCFAELKYRPSFAGCNHSFWWVQNLAGERWILSGGPNSFGKLTVFMNLGDSGWQYPEDNAGQPTHWFSGVSKDHCYNVSDMLERAFRFPRNIRYVAIEGPNSNTAARKLSESVSYTFTSPPNACGWDSPLI